MLVFGYFILVLCKFMNIILAF
uniref:Uncharacterized protein n=1 Tax=Rhizophora mucronata TaxID=61149 RepID=A0A2P2P9S3_RHIMU